MEDRILVAVRVRPISEGEKINDFKPIVSTTSDGGDVILLNPLFFEYKNQSDEFRKLEERKFTFDFCFNSMIMDSATDYANQRDVYNSIGIPILNSSIMGYNCSLFAYGQTGSGKTYTMMGQCDNDEEYGIIPRLTHDVLNKKQLFLTSTERNLHEQQDFGNNESIQKFSIQVSFFEIYNERIFDLLASDATSSCRVREHPTLGVYVDPLTKRDISNFDDVRNTLQEGNMKRQTASTLMNIESSRSHAVFTIYLSQKIMVSFRSKDGKISSTEIDRNSKISLVDLAGSERASATGATGDRLKEATNINRSLSVLGDVIKALSEQASFVPYRNSVLTFALRDSLGGNSKTTMLATISPAETYYNESMSTLRYVERAKTILSKAVVNDDLRNDPFVKHLQQELASYKAKLLSAMARIRNVESEYALLKDSISKPISAGEGSALPYSALPGTSVAAHMYTPPPGSPRSSYRRRQSSASSFDDFNSSVDAFPVTAHSPSVVGGGMGVSLQVQVQVATPTLDEHPISVSTSDSPTRSRSTSLKLAPDSSLDHVHKILPHSDENVSESGVTALLTDIVAELKENCYELEAALASSLDEYNDLSARMDRLEDIHEIEVRALIDQLSAAKTELLELRMVLSGLSRQTEEEGSGNDEVKTIQSDLQADYEVTIAKLNSTVEQLYGRIEDQHSEMNHTKELHRKETQNLLIDIDGLKCLQRRSVIEVGTQVDIEELAATVQAPDEEKCTQVKEGEESRSCSFPLLAIQLEELEEAKRDLHTSQTELLRMKQAHDNLRDLASTAIERVMMTQEDVRGVRSKSKSMEVSEAQKRQAPPYVEVNDTNTNQLMMAMDMSVEVDTSLKSTMEYVAVSTSVVEHDSIRGNRKDEKDGCCALC